MSSAASRRLRVGIVGAGYVSRHHINALRKLDFVDVVGIVDIDLAAARAVAAQFSIPLAGSSLAELATARPEAVYVLTPLSSHCAVTLEALALGCHVLVEKPMAESVEDCDAMIAAAHERGLLLTVNHSDRLDPVVVAALEKVRSGVCGDLIAVDFIRSSDYAQFSGGVRSGPHRRGAYPFQDVGCHGLYLLEAFLGPIGKLQVDYRSIAGDTPLFDDWRVVADCERGSGRLHLSWLARPMQSRLIVQGTRGYLEIDRFMQTLSVNRQLPGPKLIGMVLNAFFGSLSRAGAVVKSVLRFATRTLPPSPGIYAGAMDFARAIVEQRAPLVSPEEGKRNVALMSEASARANADADRIFLGRLLTLPLADALVTGATGFLGSALVRRLVAEGCVVRVLVRKPAQWLQSLSQVQIVVGDLGDPEIVDHAIAGVRTVYHVGAAMRGSPEQFRAGTTVAVLNVIESVLRHAVPRLVYVSSLSVMDHAGRREGTVLRENSAYEPHPQRRGLYTQTKLEAERSVIDAMAHRGLPAVILRPGQIFGTGTERVPPNGVIALGGRWILVGNGTLRLPLVYIDDVIDALVLAGSEEGATGGTFNIVDPQPVTQATYLAACRHKLGGSLKVLRTPVWFMMCVATGVEVLAKLLRRELPLSRYRVRSLRPLANFDGAAARSILKWEPRAGVSEGLRRTFDIAPPAVARPPSR